MLVSEFNRYVDDEDDDLPPNQIIRAHEQNQAAPGIIRVQAPAENPALIHVISKSLDLAHVERVVHRSPSPQISNVHKPAPPPARIVQVVRARAAAPRIEFLYEETPAHEVELELFVVSSFLHR